MRIEGVIWLRDIVDKLAFKHHVETDEVEEVLNGKPKFRFVEKGERKEETVPVRAFHLQEDERSVDIERKRHGEKREKAI